MNVAYVDSDRRMMCYIKSKARPTKFVTELSRFDRSTNYANIGSNLVNASLNTMNYSSLTVEPNLFC